MCENRVARRWLPPSASGGYLRKVYFQGMRIKYANHAIEKLTRFSRQELLEMKFTDLFQENAKKDVRNWGRQAPGGGYFHREGSS